MFITLYVILWLLSGALAMVLGNRITDEGKYDLTVWAILFGSLFGPLILLVWVCVQSVKILSETKILSKVILKGK